MLKKGSTVKTRYAVCEQEPDYQGKLTYVWPDGDRYEGEFKNGRLHGYGAFFWRNGRSYEGEWQDDLPHGRGVFTWPDGSKYKGLWEQGKVKEDSRQKSNASVQVTFLDKKAKVKLEEEARSKAEEEEIIKKEVGDKFLHVLLDSGVYKRNEEGQEAFIRFMKKLGFKKN
jgi:hypothetical protein